MICSFCGETKRGGQEIDRSAEREGRTSESERHRPPCAGGGQVKPEQTQLFEVRSGDLVCLVGPCSVRDLVALVELWAVLGDRSITTTRPVQTCSAP